jgi:hypothetical protein
MSTNDGGGPPVVDDVELLAPLDVLVLVDPLLDVVDPSPEELADVLLAPPSPPTPPDEPVFELLLPHAMIAQTRAVAEPMWRARLKKEKDEEAKSISFRMKAMWVGVKV